MLNLTASVGNNYSFIHLFLTHLMSTRSVPLTNQLKQLENDVDENQECAIPRKETVGGFSLV